MDAAYFPEYDCRVSSRFAKEPHEINLNLPLIRPGRLVGKYSALHLFLGLGVGSILWAVWAVTEQPTPVVEAVTCVTAPSGLLSWWDGDAVSGSDAFDIAGGNDGTIVGGVTQAPGQVGQAFSFDGAVGTGVEVPDNSSLRFSGSFTIDAWINTTDAGTESVGSFFADVLRKRNRDDGGNMDIVLGMRNNAARFVIVDDAGVSAFANGTHVVNDGQWHHIAGVRNRSSNLVQLYVDGILDTSIADTTGSYVQVNAVPWKIGNSPGSGSIFFPWTGLIDEVEIYDRALSASEIQAIFNAGSAGKCKSAFEPPPPTPIPATTTWGLIALTGLAFAVVLWRLRRAYSQRAR